MAGLADGSPAIEVDARRLDPASGGTTGGVTCGLAAAFNEALHA
jgi:hypothetical protein